jgi:hypothetical protein
MNRDVCQHFVSMDQKCEDCDGIYYGKLLEESKEYRELVKEAAPVVETYKPDSTSEKNGRTLGCIELVNWKN